MKEGKPLAAVAAAVYLQLKDKRDYVASTKSIELIEDNKLRLNNVGEFNVNDIVHKQIGDRLGIPSKYYERMRQEAPSLLRDNINHWFQNAPEDRMVRTINNDARAFLSNRYRRLDNFDLMEAIMPALSDVPQLRVESCSLTASRLYIKAVTPRIEGELSPGDVVNAGIVITNSEVGMGAFRVEPMIYRLVCKNGLIVADHSMQKYHTGKTISAEEQVMMLYSDETLAADDRAFWLKARDVVKGSLAADTFKNILDVMREAKTHKITGDINKSVLELSNRTSLTLNESSGVLRYLIEGCDLSQLGMANAVTRFSQDVKDYDRATDLERIGGKIITLTARDWKPIAEAA